MLTPVLISGKQGSGKSKTAKALARILAEHYDIMAYRFAEPLYRMHDAVLGVLKDLGMPVPAKDGRLLQLLGTEWGRQTLGPDIWVRCAQVRYTQALEAIQSLNAPPASTTFHMQCENPHNAVFLIDDLRFVNELEAFVGPGRQGYAFRLEADREVRKARTESWRDVDDHQSETDLDARLGDFSLVLKTDGRDDEEAVAKKIADYLSFVL